MAKESQEFTALIIDDEQHAREMLRAKIEENLPEIGEIREASDAFQGMELIKSFEPNLVFLDILMPTMNGLEMVKRLKNEFNISIKVVFVTAYSEYAVDAFKMASLHYLVKPTKGEDLKVAFERFKAEITTDELMDRIKVLEENLENRENSKLSIKVKDGYKFVNPEKEILYLEADNNCTIIHLESDQKHYQTKVLKYYDFLESRNFYRIHQSYLINMDFVKKEVNEGNAKSAPEIKSTKYFALMSDGKKLPIARRRRRGFWKRLRKNI